MIVVTGGHGFIGTNLVQWLDKHHFDYHVIDRKAENEHELNLLPPKTTTVVHLAANADVRGGWNNPKLDIEQNFMLTAKVLETMRHQNVRNLVFASTGSVYRPQPRRAMQRWMLEDDPVEATSLYAASKIAAEQLIAAYTAAGHLDSAVVLRFVSVLGAHYSHGLIYDFVKKLHSDATHLGVLAPGTSEKSYVSVHDVVQAIMGINAWQPPGFNIYNVGTHAFATPTQIAEWVVHELCYDAPVVLEGETWTGDNPSIKLDSAKLRRLGWRPKFTIEQAVRETAAWMHTQQSAST